MGDESTKVVSLRGEPVRAPGEVNPVVVKELEKLLEMARSGELHGFAVALLHSDRSASYRIVGFNDFKLIGATEVMKSVMCRTD